MNKGMAVFFANNFLKRDTHQKGLSLTAISFGYVFFLAFFVIAWFFYKERMIPFDGAFYCFKMVDSGTFNIEHNRFASVLTQLLPWTLLQLDADLETIIRFYSLNFVLIQFLVFIAIAYGFKDYKSALMLLLALCLGYRYQFYVTVSEAHQIIAPLVLMYALLSSSWVISEKRKDQFFFVISFVLLCLVVSSLHMLSFLLVSFIVCYVVLENKYLLFNKSLWISLVLGYSIFIYKMLSVPKHGYDASKMVTFAKLKMTCTHLSEIPAFIFFKEEFVKNYYLLILVAIIVCALYIYRGKWILLAFILLSLAGFFFLIISYNITTDSPVVYQNYYGCFGLMLAIPLVVELTAVFQVKVTAVVVASLLLFSTVKIIQCGRMYEMRMEYFSRIEQNVREFPERKFIVQSRNIAWNMICTEWSIGFETLIHSALVAPDSSMTFAIVNNIADYDSMMYKPNTFIGVLFSPYWFTSENMSQRYFRIKNTPYRILNNVTHANCTNAHFSAANLSIHFNKKSDTSLSSFRYQLIPIEVNNHSEDTLYSGFNDKDMVTIGYKLYDEQGRLIRIRPDASLLEMDVYPHRKKVVSVDVDYLKRGTYTLAVDLVYNRKKWMRLQAKQVFKIY